MTKLKNIATGPSAPFLYFDTVLVRGVSSAGVAQLTLGAVQLNLDLSSNSAVQEPVAIAHLRCAIPALRDLRGQIDEILAAVAPIIDRSKAN